MEQNKNNNRQQNKSTRKVGNGEGTLYKDKSLDLWVYQYYYNGKRKKIKQRKKESKREFMKRVTEIKSQLNTGAYIENNNITIYELGLELIENKLKRNQIGECTYRRDIQTLEHLRKSNLKDKRIQKANFIELQEFLNSKIRYSSSLINKIYILLNNIFSEAIKRGYIIRNPMNNVKKPKSQKQDKKVEAFSLEEQEKFIQQLSLGEKYRDIFIIALYTGMRMGEILALKTKDIDFTNKEIHIKRTLTKDKKDKTIIGDTTKTYAGNRTIPITPLFEKELRQFK